MLVWEDMTSEEREKYVNQDFVSQREVLIPRIIIEDRFSWDTESFYDFSNKKIGMKGMIELLYKDGMSVDNISYHLPCTVKYIKGVIKEVNSV